MNKDDLSSYKSGWCIASGIIQCFLSMSSTYIVMLFMQGRIQDIEFGGVQAVFAGADAGLGIPAHKPR